VFEERDLTTDFIPLRYDPGQVTPERIVEVVRQQGFEGVIVPAPKPAAEKPPGGGDNR
jgi:hypothetical protein